MTARKIERMLETAGVPEGAQPPYLTTARRLFATIAWQAVKTVPTGAVADELVRNAGVFVARFWDGFNGGYAGSEHPVVGRHSVNPNADGTLQPKRGMAFVSGAAYMPSIRKASPARHVMERDMPIVEAVAAEVTKRAMDMLSEEMPGIAVRRSNHGQVTRWAGIGIELVIEGHVWNALGWTPAEMLNKSTDDLLRMVGTIPPLVHDAIRRRDALLRRKPAIIATLDEIATKSGLPIGFSLAPLPHKSADVYDTMVMMRGYGPGGEPATHKIGAVGDDKSGIGAIDKLGWFTNLNEKLATQARLHAQYGPVPSATRGDWSIDVVTARMLIDAPDAAVTLARAISSGKAGTGNLELRVCSRQPHRLLGRGPITHTASWHGDEIRIVGQQMPQTVMEAMVGRRIDEIVESPLLKDAGTIAGVRIDRYKDVPRIRIRVNPTMKPLNLGRTASNVEL